MEATVKLRQAVKEYKQGKADAFTVLYNESSKYVYTCIYKVMAGNDNAQDIVSDIMQDTYVEISKYISQLEDEDKFLSWAGTIATRKCYAYLKKNKKYVLLNEEDNTFENLSDDDNIIPEEVMQDKEKQRLVREIIETQLSEMQKLCVIAYYYNEQKQSEIAEEFGIPENTVKTNLSRAKAKIKDGVLDLEKKQGTKLYSVAPFLLLLFQEEVQSAVVPKDILQSVMSATSAGATAGKGILAKITTASLKAKIIAGVVAVGVIGGAAGTLYVAGQQNEEVAAENVETAIETEVVVEDMAEQPIEREVAEDKSAETAEENSAEETNEETVEPTVEVTENEAEPTYTFLDMSKIMYAQQTVNVRDLPDTDGNKLGGLSANEEVSVTGQCLETNWYRIEYNGGIGYVSDKYLAEDKLVEEVPQTGAQQQSSSNGGYNTVYMENDSAIYYASDDGMTCIGVIKATGEKSPVLYTAEGIKANYPEIGQVIYNEDGSIKILTCGCCSSVETEYGIMSYVGSQATAGALGYSLDHVEDHPDFARSIGWIGSTPNTWPHNLTWYYYVK